MPTRPDPSRKHVLDMFHAGVRSGRPRDKGDSMRIASDEGERVARLLRRLARRRADLQVVERLPDGAGSIEYGVRSAEPVESGEWVSKTRSVSAELWLTNAATGTATLLKATVRWANSGTSCWLNLQANPTSLLAGTNALPAALGLGARAERLHHFRYPFLLLGRVLNAIDRSFDWSPETAQRLDAGEIALHNVQIALYLPLASRKELRRFLDWLYAVYCTPIVAKGWRVYRLGRHLKLRADAELDDDERPTGVLFRRADAAGHAILTVNFYDKLGTLNDQERRLLGSAGRDFLERHLRVDITLHRPMLDRLAKAAGLEDARTVADFCDAVGVLNARAKKGGGPDFDGWLREQAFGRYLRLAGVLRFCPGDAAAVQAKLSRRPHLMAVWDEWTGATAKPGAGGIRHRPPLAALLRARGIPASSVRGNIAAVKRAGLDPNIPPPLFDRLAMLQSLWGFGDAEAADYARALAAGAAKALMRLLRRNRRFVGATRARLERVARALTHPVWALALGPARVPAPPRSAGRRPRRKAPWFDVMGIGHRGALPGRDRPVAPAGTGGKKG